VEAVKTGVAQGVEECAGSAANIEYLAIERLLGNPVHQLFEPLGGWVGLKPKHRQEDEGPAEDGRLVAAVIHPAQEAFVAVKIGCLQGIVSVGGIVLAQIGRRIGKLETAALFALESR